MSQENKPEIVIRITRESDEQIKTTVANNAGEDKVLHILSGVVKLFFNDQPAMEAYAALVRNHLETESAKKKEGNTDE